MATVSHQATTTQTQPHQTLLQSATTTPHRNAIANSFHTIHSPSPNPSSQPQHQHHNGNNHRSHHHSLSARSSSSTLDRPSHPPSAQSFHHLPSRHPSSTCTVSPPKFQRSTSGGILSLAAAALDRTHSALASIPQSSVIRPRQSNSALSRLSLLSNGASTSDSGSPEKPASFFRSSSSNSLASSLTVESKSGAHDLPSQRYVDTDPNRPLPVKGPATDKNKMHQTSSRLLRMTDDDRPFTKDFKDLFATLIVSLLPLSAHRVRLTKVEYTFLSEDAINNLGSLKFSQSNRMPDPKDPSRIVTTTTTTTFSMAKDMARSICQRFVEARFIESADGKYQQVYKMMGSVWQLTPKGVAVLDTFCARNGIQQKQVAELAAINSAQLVFLERDQTSDKLLHDRGTIEVIFRRFVGADARNIKPNANAADSDSLHDYKDGLTGVKMAAERKVNGRTFRDTFTGRATTDWLMDCSTIVDRRETQEIAALFVEYEFIEAVAIDKAYIQQNPTASTFQPTKYAIYQITQRGKDIISGSGSRGCASESDHGIGSQRNGITRDSNTQRLEKILADPALRLLFRENLRDTHCEENLSFYMDVDEFVRSCKSAIRTAQKNPNSHSMDAVKETMAQAYGIYNAFLAPGSPCELNIDHQLRNNLATRMTKAVGQDGAMIETLQEVTGLFEDAQNAVFKLMASDSVPKFLRNAKYEQQLRNYESELAQREHDRSQSRSNQRA